MCDRVYTHMGPALEKMTAQALRESGRDEKDAKRLTGVALYGILMMARRGDMTLEGAMDMICLLYTSILFYTQSETPARGLREFSWPNCFFRAKPSRRSVYIFRSIAYTNQ